MKLSTFQVIFLGAFVFFAIAGVITFATFQSSGTGDLPPVTIWGTLPNVAIEQFLKSDAVASFDLQITYVQKSEETFSNELTEALARGTSPDLIILSDPYFLSLRNKLLPISEKSLPLRSFKDSFIEAGELFVSSAGIYAVPIAVDPMLMYWNRGLYGSAGISTPPRSWDEFFTLAQKFNQYDDNGNILQTIAPLGEFVNVQYAKSLLATLILQGGNSIIREGGSGLESVLSFSGSGLTPPAESALLFYTEFANPSKPVYSWNKSLPNSTDAFVSGVSGTYFGLASELLSLRRRNPNLNFDIALMPQVKGATTKLTYGKVYALAIPRLAPNPTASFEVLKILAGESANAALAESLNLPPVHRSLLSTPPSDAYLSTFYSSALVSRAWLDPSPKETSVVFRDMVESVNSGKERISAAISRAQELLRVIIDRLGK